MKKTPKTKTSAGSSLLLALKKQDVVQGLEDDQAIDEIIHVTQQEERKKQRGMYPRLVPPGFMPPAGECATYVTDQGAIQPPREVTINLVSGRPVRTTVPEAGCIMLREDVDMFLDGRKSLLYLHGKDREPQQYKVKRQSLQILQHLFEIKDNPSNRRSCRVKDLAEKFTKNKSSSSISNSIHTLERFCSDHHIQQLLIQTTDKQWMFNP
ncbi:MAG: hypothetical protein WCS85_04225 [Candidatus Peribacteraceae bacterium]|jgi:hypothetical protein